MYLIHIKNFLLAIFTFLLFGLVINTLAQTPTTIYTPLGTEVLDTYLLDEFTAQEIQYLNQYWQAQYPNATLIGNSSKTYNCHAYAWRITGIGGGSNCWIGFNYIWPEDIYWLDGSYALASSQEEGQKVSYLPDWQSNHSAITTSTYNIFKSKWGPGPLMQHSYDYCPYYFSTPPTTTLNFYYYPWPVGVEDWIEIILESTNFNVNQSYLGYNTSVKLGMI